MTALCGQNLKGTRTRCQHRADVVNLIAQILNLECRKPCSFGEVIVRGRATSDGLGIIIHCTDALAISLARQVEQCVVSLNRNQALISRPRQIFGVLTQLLLSAIIHIEASLQAVQPPLHG